MTGPRLEIAVGSASDAHAAARAGADRLELCADLAAHGFTPDASVVGAAAALVSVPVVALLRPRGPGFSPGAAEFRSMLADAERLLAAGAAGLAFGVLTPDGEVDAARARELFRACAGREAVFHRAVDLTPDPVRACAILADLGVVRVLSAGQAPAQAAAELAPTPAGLHGSGAGAGVGPGGSPGAALGAPDRARLARLRSLVERVGSRIGIVACGGVRSGNAAELVRETGCAQVHSSCRVGGVFDAGEAGRLAGVLASRSGPGG